MPNPMRTHSATSNGNNINVVSNKFTAKQHTLNIINALNGENEIDEMQLHRMIKTRSDDILFDNDMNISESLDTNDKRCKDLELLSINDSIVKSATLQRST